MTEQVKAGRLREAREYLGFTREQVDTALGRAPGWLQGIEEGRGPLYGGDLSKLSRLYRRPLWWLFGENRWQPTKEILGEVEHLSPADREAVLDFAEWLNDAGPPPARRNDG